MKKRIVTVSELQSAQSCMQLWQWRYGLGYRPRSQSPAPLRGSALHNGLEIWYRYEDLNGAYAEIENTFLRYLSGNPGADMNECRSLMDLVKDVFTEYVKYWGRRDFKVAKDPVTGEPLVEAEFMIPVYTPSGRASSLYNFGGKVDLVIVDQAGVHAEPGEWIVFDHKARLTIDSEKDYNRLVIDQQGLGYAFAMSVYLGVPIAGFGYNLIRMKRKGAPKINKNGLVSLSKCDTDADTLINTLVQQDEILCALTKEERKAQKLSQKDIDWDAYAPEIARLNKVKFFDRGFQRYTEDDLKNTQLNLYQTAMMIHQTKFFYKNNLACDHFGGCRYRDLCMGLDCEGKYDIITQRHTELSMDHVHLPVSTGWNVVDHVDEEQWMGMDAILEDVN